MPPALFTRSAHHSVPRSPAAPTGAAMPARIAITPIFTGSVGTPGRAWARAGRGAATAAAAPAPMVVRKSRLVVAMRCSFVFEGLVTALALGPVPRSSAAEPGARELCAGGEAPELLRGHPARHREEPAVRHERELVGRNRAQALPRAVRDVLGSLHVKALHVNHAARHLAVHAHVAPHLDLGHLAVRV